MNVEGPLRNVVRASAPGKIIITGEHFVVHGSNAIAAAINKRATVSVSFSESSDIIVSGEEESNLSKDDGRFVAAKYIARNILKDKRGIDPVKIQIQSEIPIGSGLGSSAAISVATSAALLSFLGLEMDKAKINEFAKLGEQAVHGNPSGIDTATSLNGGIVRFNRSGGASPIQLSESIQFLVIFSGDIRNTSDLISKVAERRTAFRATFDNLTRSASFLSDKARLSLETGDLPNLGALMNMNKAALSWIGVSTPRLQELIEKILENEPCLGAKITGAGGGGSVIALPKPESGQAMVSKLSKLYPYAFLTTVPEVGLRLE